MNNWDPQIIQQFHLAWSFNVVFRQKSKNEIKLGNENVFISRGVRIQINTIMNKKQANEGMTVKGWIIIREKNQLVNC